jgi:C-terminal processing protease CtpA/Prc
MKEERWQSILNSMVQARAIILDMRGYPSAAVLSMIGHFIDKGIRSPRWEIPVIGTPGHKISYWTVNPLKPRLKAKLVVLLDGRAASAAETFLQLVHDSRLATFVGETSAGTNGIPTTASLPGGFSMRFTAMRVPFPDGSALQGRGISPDVVVHPTLEGIRAGRDEILEAGIDMARKLSTY